MKAFIKTVYWRLIASEKMKKAAAIKAAKEGRPMDALFYLGFGTITTASSKGVIRSKISAPKE